MKSGESLRVAEARKYLGCCPERSPSLPSDFPPPPVTNALSWARYGIPVVNGVAKVFQRQVANRGIPGDLALIMCHYGQDAAHLQASNSALAITMKDAPATFLVEAVDPDCPRHFDTQEGITYIPRVVTEASKGLWLKEPLWDIGAKEAIAQGYTKLAFLDMDCSFCTQDWAQQISNALENLDVCHPHEYAYYADQPDDPVKGLRPSRGKNNSTGHPGMALAMTAKFFMDELDGHLVYAVDGQGDKLLWFKMLGCPERPDIYLRLSKELTMIDGKGMMPTPRTGHAGLLVVHHGHGPLQHRNYLARSVVAKAAFPAVGVDVTYLPDGMPAVVSGPAGLTCQTAMPLVMRGNRAIGRREARDIYDDAAQQHYGPIDEDNPLVVSVALRTGKNYNYRHVLWLKGQFDAHCKAPFRFVCFSDTDIPGVETIPFITSPKETPFQYCQKEQYRNIFPKGTSVLTCDIDTVVYRDFVPHRCPEGSFFMLREYGNWVRAGWATWGGGLTYYNGDYSIIFDDYMTDVRAGGIRRPSYTFIGCQESSCNSLRKAGIYPQSIESHFAPRYYNDDINDIPEDAHFVIFPGNPKPWRVRPLPPWIPTLN